MARFLVTGGTGFIGSALLPRLVDAGHEVVVFTRRPDKFAGQFGNAVSFIDSFDAVSGETCFQAVINLAGEGIGDKRWSENASSSFLIAASIPPVTWSVVLPGFRRCRKS